MLHIVGRSLALLIGVFLLVCVTAAAISPSLDATIWLLDVRHASWWPRIVLQALIGLTLFAHAANPAARRSTRQAATLGATVLVGLIATIDAMRFWALLAQQDVYSAMPLPMSLLLTIAMGVVMASILLLPQPQGRMRATATACATMGLSLVIVTLGQIYCFGKTDYRRPADAIVVFGARAYADGRPSDALADRVRTACDLYHQGYASLLIMSGGPGDGDVHETQAMLQLAVSLGVPADAIVIDEDGLNTRATVAATAAYFHRLDVQRVLTVSHFYHLPRIKLTFQRAGLEVYTVPARERYTLTKMPLLIAREVAAIWYYAFTV